MDEEDKPLKRKIAETLDEARVSNAIHHRKCKDLHALRRSKTPSSFFNSFSKALLPLFAFQRRTSSSERVVRFISAFAAARDSDAASFLDDFLRFLLAAASNASNRTPRFRACQIISEVETS